ncbi:MAG: hypothetical protein Q7J65_04245 [Candidatus Marinimicrobia bacterium]|nr:hypothetical protein [Candidatus Neomarinimicrobiota bacterium]
MEYMALTELVKYGTPAMLFALVILGVYQATCIRQLQRELSELKKSITWGDTCTDRHKGIERRITRLENAVFPLAVHEG